MESLQRQAARFAAVAYLLSFAVVVYVNFGIFGRLIVRADMAQTILNIRAHETLFRIGIIGQLLYCIGVLVVLAAFYVILRPINRNFALLAALGRLVHATTWIVVSLNLFAALRLALTPDAPPALVKLFLSGMDAYYAGLLFWSLGETIAAFLWWKSRYIPAPLALFGVIGSAWCAGCTIVYIIEPSMTRVVNLWAFDTPMALYGIALSVLLLAGRFNAAPLDGAAPALQPSR